MESEVVEGCQEFDVDLSFELVLGVISSAVDLVDGLDLDHSSID